MGRIIAVTSGKGGVGKSSVSVQLAFILCQAKQKVLLVDLDAGMRCLDIMLSVSDRLLFDLNDILENEKTLKDVALYPDNYLNLAFVGAPAKEGIDPIKFKDFLVSVKDDFDFVILDFPAGGVNDIYRALPRYTEALVVCNADAVSVRDAAVQGNDLKSLGLLSVRLILNRVNFEVMKKGITSNIDDIIDKSGIQLIGLIPQSMEVYLAGCSGVSLNRKSKAYKAIDRIAKRILGNDIPLKNMKKIKGD